MVVKHPQALGHGYIDSWNNSVRGLLTLQTNVVIHSYIKAGSPLGIQIADTGAADIIMDIPGRTETGMINVVPRGENATGRLAIRVQNSDQGRGNSLRPLSILPVHSIPA